jgi:hypothetical protein
MSLVQYQQMLHDARGAQLVHLDDLGGKVDDEDYLERTWSAILRSRAKFCVTSASAMRWSMQ